MVNTIKLETIKNGDTVREMADKVNGAVAELTTALDTLEDSVYTKSEVNTLLGNKMSGMAYKGTLGVGGTVTTLPTVDNAKNGDTYKVITAGNYGGIDADVGDLFIATVPETNDRVSWTHVPSGDDGDVYTDSDLVDEELVVASGNGKKVKSSGKKLVTKDINGGLNDILIPKSRTEEIPSLYSVEYAVREAMPVWILMLAFKSGKDLYSPDHADYNKLILVTNSAGKNLTASDTPTATAMARLLDRGYRITNLTRGFHNQLISNVEFSFNTDSEGIKTYTIKIAAEADKQDSLKSITENEAGIVWLERYFTYVNQGYYVDPPQN